MPTSNKKKRSKQRKAAKAAATPEAQNARNPVRLEETYLELPDRSLNIYHEPYSKGQYGALVRSIESLSPDSVVEKIGRGLGMITEVASESSLEYRLRLIEAGLIPTVLELVGRCKESFTDVLVDLGAKDGDTSFVAMPSIWVGLLSNLAGTFPTVRDDCIIEIAEGISGDLMKCMLDDTKRVLFNSNMYWHNTLFMFMTLLMNLLETEGARDIILRKRGLVKKVIRCMFWQICRPEIVEESKNHVNYLNQDRISVMTMMVCDFVDKAILLDETDTKEVGITPYLSKDKDIERTPFVLGIFNLLKSKDPVYSNQHKVLLSITFKLINAGAYDKRIVNEVVNFGLNHVFNYDDAFMTTSLAFSLVFPQGKEGSTTPFEPNDSLYAAFIDAGLFEMILRLLPFTRHDDDNLAYQLGRMARGAGGVMMHKHSSKAISKQRDKVKLALSEPEVTALANGKDNRQEIVEAIKSIVTEGKSVSRVGIVWSPASVKKTSCLACSKDLDDKNIKRCSNCKAIYCSRECQVNDWKNGHKESCNVMKDMKREEDQKSRFLTLGRKYFTENVNNFLMQAILLGHDIVDCVVVVNLRSAPHSITVELRSVYLEKYVSSHDKSHVKENLDRNRLARAVTVAYQETHGNTSIRSYPQSWDKLQHNVMKSNVDRMDSILQDSATREELFGSLFCDWFDNVYADTIIQKHPAEMSMRELKVAIGKVGLAADSVEFVEKSEFVTLLQNHRKGSK